MPAVALDDLQVAPLLLAKPLGSVHRQDAGQGQHRVEGGAQLVAHVG